MNNKLITRIYIYIYILTSLMRISYAQFGTSFNYTQVNTNAFTVPASFMVGSNQNAYNMSVLDMSQRLSAIYNNGAFNTNYNMNALIKVKKVKFGPDSVRMLIIQPIYSAIIKKRCVLLSPGNTETFSNWYLSNRYAIDLALRGYIVAYYENAGSTNANLNNSGKTTVQYFSDKVINVCNVSPNNTARDKFFTTMFINLFISNEARKYVVNNSTALQVDTTKFFLVGGSLGANTALFYGYGANNNWTANTTYNCVKNILNYSHPISNSGVRGIMSMGGGLPAPTEALGNIITSADNIPSIWFAGAGDFLANPNTSTILGPELWGALATKTTLQTNNIKHNMYLNCYGTHVFQSPSFNDKLWQTNGIMLITNSITPIPSTPPFNYILNSSQITNYLNVINTLTNQKRFNYYKYDQEQGFQAFNYMSQYFNSIIMNTVPSDMLNYIKPTCIQNPYFLSYQNNTFTIEQASLCYFFPNVLCDLNVLGYNSIAEACNNSTFVSYNNSTSCPSVSSNFSSSNFQIKEILSAERNTPYQLMEESEKIGNIDISFSNNLLHLSLNTRVQNGSIEIYNYSGIKQFDDINISNYEKGTYDFDIVGKIENTKGLKIVVVRTDSDFKTFKIYLP